MARGGRCCCAPPTPPPPPCTVNVNVTDCAGTGISGAPVTLKDSTGGVVASGTTDGSGNYSATFSSGNCPQTVVVTNGAGSYTGSLLYLSGVATVALMYGTGSVAASITDLDSGGPVASHTTTITYLGPRLAPDTTGNIPLGFWAIPGWTGNLQGTSDGSTVSNFLGDDTTYYRVCSPNFALYCNDSRTLLFVAASVANWNMAPCEICGTDISGNRVGAIPRTLHVTYNSPAGTLGTDNGAAIPLAWDATSWNGDSFNPIYDSFGIRKACVYKACRPANGVSYDDGSGPVAFGSALAQLRWGGNIPGQQCNCGVGLSYTLFTGTGCTDSAGSGGYPTPQYCGGLLKYPRSLAWTAIYGLVDLNVGGSPGDINNRCGRFSAPLDIGAVSSANCPDYLFAGGGKNTAGQGWLSCCSNPYDPSYGLSASAIVTE